MSGTGVEKNVGLAVNWLAIAAKKQHAASQATLGEILWRGDDVRQRRARGLALIILAHDNAVAGGKEPSWIGELYREALGASNKATRKDAEAMLPELGGVKSAAVVPAAKAKPAEIVVMPAGGATDAVAPAASTATSDAAPLGSAAPPPASMGLSVGFGATSTEAGGPKR
jgi:exopolysaccharide production negative regulator